MMQIQQQQQQQASGNGQERRWKQQMMANGECEALARVDPAAGKVCNDLFRYGFYPKPLNYSVDPHAPIIPSCRDGCQLTDRTFYSA